MKHFILLITLLLTPLSLVAEDNDTKKSREALEKITEANITKEQALKLYTENITANESKTEPIRQQDVSTIYKTLMAGRSSFIVGDPGVGQKSAVTSAAQSLAGKEVFMLLPTKISSGVMIQSQIETRIDLLFEALAESNGQKILYVNLEQAKNVPNLLENLKFQMARGRLTVIADMTFEQYSEFVEKDADLRTLADKHIIRPPTEKEVVNFLTKRKGPWLKQYKILVTDVALEETARLVFSQFSGESAIEKSLEIIEQSLIDQSDQLQQGNQRTRILQEQIENLKNRMSSINLDIQTGHGNKNSMQALENLQIELTALESELNELQRSDSRSGNIQEQLNEAKEQLKVAEKSQDLTKISELKYGIIPNLESALKSNVPVETPAITESDIRRKVAVMKGLSLDFLNRSIGERIDHLEKNLKKNVLGQNHAIDSIVSALKISQANVLPSEGPLGVFMLAGTTGVGKTLVTEQTALHNFGSKDNLIRVDLTEYSDQTSVNKLIGAPSGYVGYEEGGHLTEALRRQSHAVILLDEIEKAHKNVYTTLLNAIDNGHLTDAQGRVIDLKNAIVIMTTNLGSEYFEWKADQGKGLKTSDIEAKYDFKDGELKGLTVAEIDKMVLTRIAFQHDFPPEFIGRIHKIIAMNRLDFQIAQKITALELEKIIKHNLKENGITIQVSKNAIEALTLAGFDMKFGARPLKNTIRTFLGDTLADLVIQSKAQRGDTVQVQFSKDKNGKGGKFTAKINGSSSSRGLFFRTENFRGTEAAKAKGEVGKKLDTSDKGVVKKATKKARKK